MEIDMTEAILRDLRDLLLVDSTTGFSGPLDELLMEKCRALGFAPRRLNKGGVRVDLGGEGRPLFITAHGDDIGLMVRRILSDGTLEVFSVGGNPPFQTLHENVRVYTRHGRVLTGTVRRRNASLHTIPQADRDDPLDYGKNICITLDEPVYAKADTEALGVEPGNMVALDPRLVETDAGYIKSRFLDDKASCAAILAMMRAVASGKVKLNRKVYVFFGQQEEIGMSGACAVPEDVVDYLAVDIGCVSPDTCSDERKVTITALDTSSPYNGELVKELADLCEARNIPFAIDLMVPHYGSDADVAMRAGIDARHGLIGPGVRETHGYERTHRDALENTYRLLCAVIEG